MPVPDLIAGELRCAQLPAELAPVLADLARLPALAFSWRPDIDPIVAVALRDVTTRIAGEDDPAGLAVDHPSSIKSKAQRRSDDPGWG